MGAPEKLFLTIIFAIIALVVSDALYQWRDHASGKTELVAAIVVDKEHEIVKDDGCVVGDHLYFYVNNNGAIIQAVVSEQVYRTVPIGSRVIIERRVGGLSKQVVENVARPYEGAEVQNDK